MLEAWFNILAVLFNITRLDKAKHVLLVWNDPNTSSATIYCGNCCHFHLLFHLIMWFANKMSVCSGDTRRICLQFDNQEHGGSDGPKYPVTCSIQIVLRPAVSLAIRQLGNSLRYLYSLHLTRGFPDENGGQILTNQWDRSILVSPISSSLSDLSQ
jgi:hypothetical protein